MSSTAETALTLYLYVAEPGMTAAGSRSSQPRVVLVRPEAGATAVQQSDRGSSIAPEAVLLSKSRATLADAAVAQMLRMERFDADWDGNQAAKPLASSLGDAREFVRLLAPESVVPRPALHADGHAVLLLQSTDVYAELEFLGGKKIGFYARRGGEEWSEDFFFDAGMLPEGLSQIGFIFEQLRDVAAA